MDEQVEPGKGECDAGDLPLEAGSNISPEKAALNPSNHRKVVDGNVKGQAEDNKVEEEEKGE